jgi:hypothetical protein
MIMVSGVELIITWLKPLGEVGAQRGPGAALPFRLVECVAGSDDKITDSGIYQVSTFASTYDQAESQAALTHQRMLKLGPPFAAQERITLSNNSVVWVDSVTTSQRPLWVQYTEAAPITRFVARYSVGIRFR